MRTVGVRELKNRLSEYIRQVKSGDALLITDRGAVVAELSRPGQGAGTDDTPAGLRTLARQGLVTLGTPRGGDAYQVFPRAKRRLHARELLRGERGGQ